MTEKPTPIADLIGRLLSRGLSPLDAVEEAREVERALTTRRVSDEEQRNKWKLKKQRQRARRKGQVPGDTNRETLILTESKAKIQKQKESKKDSVAAPVSGDKGDGWPADYANQFWARYPEARKYEKAKVFAHLAKLRAEGFIDA